MIDTPRLHLRPLDEDDAPVVLAILNDPDFIAHIADRRIRDAAGAARYIAEGPVASRAAYGHAMDAVEERASGMVVGLCGLLQRPFFDAPDLGYAFLPAGRGRGYAREAAAAVLADARDRLPIRRVLATTSPDNTASIAVLTAVGFRFIELFDYPESGKLSRLFAVDL